MAETEKEAYLALISARDPEIRALLDQGFEFVTNAFKVGAAPAGLKARTDQVHVRRLQQEGYQVEVTAAYDKQGQQRPTLRAMWRKKVEQTPAFSPGPAMRGLLATPRASPKRSARPVEGP